MKTMLIYDNGVISFKYGENWTKIYKSKDPFSIIGLCNNLSNKTFIDISIIPINYDDGKYYNTQYYEKSAEKYIKNTFETEIFKKKKIEISGENACDIWAKKVFNDVKIEERFIGFIKNQYVYQLKIVTDKDLNLLLEDVETITKTFITLKDTINPPNRFNEKEIKEILKKSKLNDKKAVIKTSKRLLQIILILLTILLIFLLIGILIR